MTHVVEHKSFRYSWELVRYTYILDLESEIDIQLLELSPSHDGRILPRPWPRTSFFEVEIDQIQKGGKTVFSFRNICPVEMSQKPDWNPFHLMTTSGNTRITQRFQSQEGDIETRWLYTDDFFLIALSSGDRHDLEMLLSLTIAKLNMIALSVQSGKRVLSEFENQQQYRADMSTMFAKGVDGAFRDVPVYQQHGEMTGRDIDVSAALLSAEFQDLNASVASGWSTAAESPAAASARPKPVAAGDIPVEETVTERGYPEPAAAADHIPEKSPPAEPPGVLSAAESTAAESSSAADTGTDSAFFGSSGPAGAVAENSGTDRIAPAAGGTESLPLSEILVKINLGTPVAEENTATAGTSAAGTLSVNMAVESSSLTDGTDVRSPEERIPMVKTCSSCGTEIPGTKKFCGSCGAAVGPVAPDENIPLVKTCSSCGKEIPGTKKFCGSCGTVVITAPPAASAPSGKTCSSCGAGISGTTKFCGSCGTVVITAPPAESAPSGKTCGSCGAGISGTTKFCGSCGAAVITAPSEEPVPVSSGSTANAGDDLPPASSRPAAEPVVNLKSIKELEDLSWLTD